MFTNSLLAAVLAALAPLAAGSSEPTPAPRPHYSAPVSTAAPASGYDEDHPLFDCRIDGNRLCGPGALVPVTFGAAIVYLPWESAPLPWRG